MEKVKILSVGIGGYAQGYLDALLKEENPNFEIVGMVDVAPQNSAVYPRLVERGVKLYASMEAFYEEQTADLAIIVTPIHFHTTQILYALYHGSNVMCEKPLSGVSADEEILVKAMKETGKFVMIGYQWSHSDAILALKEDISAGVFGKAGETEEFRRPAVDHLLVDADLVISQLPSALLAARLCSIVIHMDLLMCF